MAQYSQENFASYPKEADQLITFADGTCLEYLDYKEGFNRNGVQEVKFYFEKTEANDAALEPKPYRNSLNPGDCRENKPGVIAIVKIYSRTHLIQGTHAPTYTKWTCIRTPRDNPWPDAQPLDDAAETINQLRTSVEDLKAQINGLMQGKGALISKGQMSATRRAIEEATPRNTIRNDPEEEEEDG